MVTWPPPAPPPGNLAAALRDVKAKSPYARVMAARALHDLAMGARSQVVGALVELLSDVESAVRTEAAVSLGQIRGAEALPELSAAIDDSSAMVRQAAVIALAEIGDRSTVPRLLAACEHLQPDVRFQALAALVGLSPDDAQGRALAALRDHDPHVRAQAIEVLGTVGSDEQVWTLVPILHDPHVHVRFAAALALGERGHDAGAGELLLALQDDERFIDAALVLGELGVRGAAGPLRKRMRRFFGHAILKVAAAAALHKLGEPEGRPFLLQVLSSRGWQAKAYAAELCAELGIREARPLLEKLRDKPGPLDPMQIQAALEKL